MGKSKKAPEMKKSKHKKGPSDFKTDQRKVGKKAKPRNETNVNFRSRQVVMPNQSNMQEKGDIVTAKQLNLTDLIAHCRHYNVNMRKEGLVGLKQLLQKFPDEVIKELSKLIDALTLTMIDNEDVVRHESRSLLTQVLEVPMGILDPFGNIFGVHVRSALTHVSKSVRDDGLVVLEMMLASPVGRHILRPSAGSILQLSCAVAQGTRSNSKRSLGVIRSVLQLMNSANVEGRITARTHIARLAQPASAEKNDTENLWTWLLDLFTTLTSSKSDLAQKETMLALLQVLEALLAVSKPHSKLPGLLVKAFPFQFAAHNPRQRQLLELLNLHLCNLLATLGVHVNPAAKYLNQVRFPLGNGVYRNRLAGPVAKDDRELSKSQLMLIVADKIAAATGNKDVISNLAMTQQNDVQETKEQDVVMEDRSESSADNDSSDSETEKETKRVDPLAAVYLSDKIILSVPLTAAALGIPLNLLDTPVPSMFHVVWPRTLQGMEVDPEWVGNWPKVLWYLGDRNPELSRFVIALLIELGKLATKSEAHAKAWQIVQGPLALFFTGGTIKILPVEVQRLAVQLLGHYKTFGKGKLLASLATSMPEFDISVSQHIIEIVLRHRRDASPLHDRMRFALTVLTTMPAGVARTVADALQDQHFFEMAWSLAQRALPKAVPQLLAFMERASCKNQKDAVEVMKGFLAAEWPELSHLDPTSAHPLTQILVNICCADLDETQHADTYRSLLDVCIQQLGPVALELVVGLLHWRPQAVKAEAQREKIRLWIAAQDPTPRLRQIQAMLPGL